MKPNVYEARDLAALLSINVKSVYAAAAAGEIPCKRIGRRFVFLRSVIDRWLASGGAS